MGHWKQSLHLAHQTLEGGFPLSQAVISKADLQLTIRLS